LTAPHNVLAFECLAFGEPRWNEAADGVRYGEQVALAIVERALALGAELHEGVTAHRQYGWEFVLGLGGSRAWCLLQRTDAWLLILEPRRSLSERQHPIDDEGAQARLRELTDAAVRALPQALALRWLTREELHSAR
jgi:hypothetical protein